MVSRVRFAFFGYVAALGAGGAAQLLACTALRDLDQYSAGAGVDAAGSDAPVVPDAVADVLPLPTPDATADTGVCAADIAKDPANCGRCGRSCLGATCSEGRCQPQVLVGSEAQPTYLALHDDRIVYKAMRKFSNFDNEAIVSVPLAGGVPVTEKTNLGPLGTTPGIGCARATRSTSGTARCCSGPSPVARRSSSRLADHIIRRRQQRPSTWPMAKAC
jgi:hypothetical protein